MAIKSRSEVTLGIEPALRSRLATMAAGRPLVIDYFTSRRCGVVIGDLAARFRREVPRAGYAQLAPVAGVRLFVDERLLPVFEDAAVTLRRGIITGLAFDMEPADRWIDFLEGNSTPA